jgi:DNA-binding transcriptional regulator LsrR (DeoR family)
MVRVLAERSGGTPYFIHAPALVSDRDERDLHFGSSSLRAIRQKWKQMDVLVMAIGALVSDHPDRESYMGEAEVFRNLEAKDAVGDICARYFDRSGRFIVDDHYQRVVGAPVEELKAARSAVCMASGLEKAEAIACALRTGVVKLLVMDEPTAWATLGFLSGQKG